MHALNLVALVATAALLAACGNKVDPQLVADQMTLSDATCAPAEIDKIVDADVRRAFVGRCERRNQFQQGTPAR
ncbi:entry exclusion lipoprotein TrbK [Pseudoduganella flava]|uniref:Entry exclusion lipoprotein TrbK n=1 Tax=Pseudoduganella flava TaxID=871742 RepID=A0A562PHC0_9BURK|nr:entry exclusion lipoprotein TrbK [Pseudoduganella flava]QGZ42580.1 entry exclusion lipoprotein TrbK [Pseudoduganella flava]TWI43733.1 entry exclusion lipoprotein TrbK [Pseudoduganella flava]